VARRLSAAAAPRLEAISLERVGLRLGGHTVLREVSLELCAGQRWLLEGANGAGKTALLKLLRGDLWPAPERRARRRYRLDGEWQDAPLLARERVAYLGPERQDRYDRHGLDARVDAVVATGLTGEDLLLEPPSSDGWRAVRRALGEVGLAGLARRRFLELSHGQRRRVLLARALVARPDLLLLDEVLNGLDAGARRAFLRSLAVATRSGIAWVMATHRSADRPRGITHWAELDAGRLTVATGQSADHRVPSPAPPNRSVAVRGRPERVGRSARTAPRAANSSLVRLERVRVYRAGRLALAPLDWQVATGEHWQVAGPNGSGKSTLLALLYGDCAPAAGGRILRDGIGPGVPLEDWRARVGLVSPELQSTFAATGCTALEIVVSGRHSSIGLNAPPTAAERGEARRALARLGLANVADRRARELSYGQLRLVLVARALVQPRCLLLLDEPFDGLDAAARVRVLECLEVAARRGAQLVIATHHDADLPSCVTRRLVLGSTRVAPRAAARAAAAPAPGAGRSHPRSRRRPASR
jgi:molybdate transport system ATP-binding protein